MFCRLILWACRFIDIDYTEDQRSHRKPVNPISATTMTNAPTPDQRSLERSALFVATLTSFLGPFMISSVNVALPAIQKELQLTAVELSWIATSYLLAVAVGLVPAGKIGDIHGRKKVFATGVLVSTIGTGLAIFAKSAIMLIALRFVQGLGASMFVTTGMAILTSIFPPSRRGRVIGIYVAAVYVGLSVGPFAGGLLTESLGWRSNFTVIVPFGFACFFLTLRYLKGEWCEDTGQRLDILGCVLYALAILSLVYGATQLPERKGVVLAATGLLLLALFLYQQSKAKFPVFEISLFLNNKTFSYSSFAALLNYSATFSVTFLISLYLQYIKGLSPPAAGTVLMAQPIMMALVSPIAGRLADKIEPRYLASTGMTITVCGVLIFSRLHPTTPTAAIITNLIFLGTGFALFSSPNMSAIMGAVEKRHYGLASGTAATMRLLGQMLSMAIATVVLALLVGHKTIAPENYDRFLNSVHIVFFISATLCSFGVYFSWFRGKMLSQ
jgi:EmrB/QacA subfamily drug resistance transporter